MNCRRYGKTGYCYSFGHEKRQVQSPDLQGESSSATQHQTHKTSQTANENRFQKKLSFQLSCGSSQGKKHGKLPFPFHDGHKQRVQDCKKDDHK